MAERRALVEGIKPNRSVEAEFVRSPHQVEIALDGKRVEAFTVKPNRNQSGAYYADEAVDKNLKLRLPVEAGPHELAVTFLRKTSALPETERQPYQAHFNMDRHPRIQPAVYSVSITGLSCAVLPLRRPKPTARRRSSRHWRIVPIGGR